MLDCVLWRLGCTASVLQEVLEGRPYDAKSDLWSLGCVVHELCSLRYFLQGIVCVCKRRGGRYVFDLANVCVTHHVHLCEAGYMYTGTHFTGCDCTFYLIVVLLFWLQIREPWQPKWPLARSNPSPPFTLVSSK